MHKSPLILSDRARLLAPGREVPLALAGFPKEIEGKPCHYRRKEIVRAGEWWHRGERKPFTVTRASLCAPIVAALTVVLEGRSIAFAHVSLTLGVSARTRSS